MRIVIAGGSGLLGRALTTRLATAGHEIVHLTRGAPRAAGVVRAVSWTPDGTVGPWISEIDHADAVVNLAGAGMADRRWTSKRKALLRSSRIESTRSLAAAVGAAAVPPAVFIQGSGIGIHGSSLDARVHTEDSPPGADFLARLAVEWEQEAQPVAVAGSRLVTVRTGVVLSRDGGALPPMARPFRFFVGGPVGTGRQYLSWITVDDWVSLVVWAIVTPDVSGPLNATAPDPATSREFSAALGRATRRPSLIPAPSFVLRFLFGEMADALLLGGQRVVPAKAIAHGFRFEHADLDRALNELLRPDRA